MKHRTYWAVVWDEYARRDFGVPSKDAVITVDYNGPEVVPCKCHKVGSHYIDPLAFFDTKKEAEACRDGNSDFKTIRVQVIFSENV